MLISIFNNPHRHFTCGKPVAIALCFAFVQVTNGKKQPMKMLGNKLSSIFSFVYIVLAEMVIDKNCPMVGGPPRSHHSALVENKIKCF